VGVFEGSGPRQLDEHVLAGLHRPHGDVGVQPGGQADVDQVHRQVGDQPVQIGGGGEPELAADRGELVRVRPKTTTSSTSGRWA
jgi:hypothetical protein